VKRNYCVRDVPTLLLVGKGTETTHNGCTSSTGMVKFLETAAAIPPQHDSHGD
jgi:hypothetical protein